MIILKTKQTSDQAKGGYCGGCGFAMEDGEINTITYGNQRKSTELRLCGEYLNRLHLAIEEVHG
jgi:hypothetical protein